MDFELSEEHRLIRETVRRVARELVAPRAAEIGETDEYPQDIFEAFRDLGLLGLTMPEQYGGSGLSFVDLVVVLEEMGRLVTPGPFFSTVALGAVALLEGGNDAQKQQWLPKMAEGKLVATVAQLEPSGRWDAAGIALEAKKDGAGYRLSGTKLFVPDGHCNDAGYAIIASVAARDALDAIR